MDKNEQAYLKLQKHLNDQAVGFPATRSGVEIKILKHIFTSEEAEITSYLSYAPEPLKTIYERVRHLVESPAELEKILDRIKKKGGIEARLKDGQKRYCCAPLVVGMYELQLQRLTPEFIRNFDEYTSQRRFGIEFLSTELPQMRTIPVAKSIHPQHKVSTFDQVAALLQQAQGPFVIIECICRKKRSMAGTACRTTRRKETCLAIGATAEMVMSTGIGRQIGQDEAMAIIKRNQEEGLVLQPSNTQKADFICSCCGCCCGMLNAYKKIPKPLDYWAANFHAVVAAGTCRGCGVCALRCPVEAVAVSASEKIARVDLNRCLGCGVCVTGCPTRSMSLSKKPVEKRPPQSREELYDIIMAKKKGRWGKFRLTAKLVVDALRTGQMHLLR